MPATNPLPITANRLKEAVPLVLRQRRQALYNISQTRRLTDAERAEFLRLTNEIETAEAAYISLLAERAGLGASVKE